jgi:hypothetical protein
MKLARRSGMKKAKVALARKIAVIMHRMLADGMAGRHLSAAEPLRYPAAVAGAPRPHERP